MAVTTDPDMPAARPARPARRPADVALAGLFLAPLAVAAGGVAALMFADRQAYPTVSSWKKAPSGFEGFLNNRLAGREALLGWNSRLRLDLLHVSPTPRVWVGDGGWLFYNCEA